MHHADHTELVHCCRVGLKMEFHLLLAKIMFKFYCISASITDFLSDLDDINDVVVLFITNWRIWYTSFHFEVGNEGHQLCMCGSLVAQ